MTKKWKAKEPKEPKADHYPSEPRAAVQPKKTTRSRGRQFRRDGMGRSERSKDFPPEPKKFHELEAGTTLEEFVADSDMCLNPNSAKGQIKAGKYTVGTAEKRDDSWVLQRPIDCARIRDPKYVLRPPCVVRGGYKGLKVAIITGVKPAVGAKESKGGKGKK